ncbi:hypothetical protein [Streptomyces sp. enrichment culture]|uniref:hypothetical protein n=1 Tax=Streptomyces sp. enrichment culture TaxID=1795815 RepID=UPI003F5712AF
MPDATRRPGEELPLENTGTTTGAHGATTGAHGATTGVPGATAGTSGATTGAHGATTGAPGTTGGTPGATGGAFGATAGAPGAGGESPSAAAHPRADGIPDGGTGHHAPERTPGPGHDGGETPERRLLTHHDGDRFATRLQHAMAGFVDGPRGAVEEADHLLQELTERLTDAVSERRRTLRRSWQAADGGSAAATDTEQLRLALRDYRELTERLLRV